MRDVFEALVLGAIQGLTEFLPISSSGHLKAVQILTGSRWGENLTLDIAVHVGTLLVVVVCFRHDLINLVRGLPHRAESRRLLFWLFLGSVPAALVGLLAKDFIAKAPSAWPASIAVGWVLTGVGLLLLGRRRGTQALEGLRLPAALTVGMAQAVAIFPGVSRSGATISAGVLAGIERGAAARFSFLLSIPAIGGAAVMECFDASIEASDLTVLAAGFLGAVVTGWLALKLLLWLVHGGRLWFFAFYTFTAAGVFLVLA